ncbi:MAG: hypothetical protein FWF51_05670 [Chitinivibrionia bacterium]|nr:hypothetical protein [Chitinivibrionia bacterium]
MKMKCLLLVIITVVLLAVFMGGCTEDPDKDKEKHVHKWVEGETISLATCEIAGKKEMICECGAKEIKEIPKLTDCNNNVHTPDVSWYDESKTEFTITTAEQLSGLAKLSNDGNYFSGKTIKLGANIMLNDTTNWKNWANNAPKNKWLPIKRFKGDFNGNGYVISGVYVNSDETGGFFKIAYGKIENLGITASYVKGGSGSFVDIYPYNALYFGVGILAGGNYYGEIINCYAIGNVEGDKYVGGLVGGSSEKGTIRNSYAIANVSGNTAVGGLIGISGRYDIISGGGGGDIAGSDVNNCYASGRVNGDNYVGGLIGTAVLLSGNGIISNCYYDKESSTQSSGVGNKPEDSHYQQFGKTTEEMQSKVFVELLNTNAFRSKNGARDWNYSVGNYPTLSKNVATNKHPNLTDFFDAGNGTAVSPYIVRTKKHLENLCTLVNIGFDFYEEFIDLKADISLNDTTNWKDWNNTPPANIWTPIGKYFGGGGSYFDGASYNKPFRGTFNGRGHIISGVYINNRQQYQALFGYMDGGEIKNIGIIASNIKGGNYSGGLVGGIGDYTTNISNCYSNVIVPIDEYGLSYYGGLAGGGARIKISNSYSILGGLVGRIGTTENSYYDKEKNNKSNSNINKGEGKTTAEMTQQETYENWDFTNIWGINSVINDGYPYLRVFQE